MNLEEIKYCPGTLSEGHSTYSRACLTKVFKGKKVHHVLPYDSPASNLQTDELFEENRKRMSISGVQEKFSVLLDKNKLRLITDGEQGEYILKPIPSVGKRPDQMPANEHLTMQIAKQVYGIETAENALIFFKDGTPAYLTKRFDLKEDGLFGKDSWKILNIALQQRIRNIQVNLERLRWLPRDQPATYIIVNIPNYHLKVKTYSETVFESRVVVGKTDQQTPIFSDQLDRIIFNPYWNVPNQLAADEIIPELIKDPNYLEENEMEAYQGSPADPKIIDPLAVDWTQDYSKKLYNFRQRPGRLNALGRVKLLFPNRHNIYIHDTPAKALFEHKKRTYSHGCIRAETPLHLVDFLLSKDDPNWNSPRIDDILASQQETRINLQQAIPIHIVYLTAFVDDQGYLNFREDVYNKDAAVWRALNQ